MKCKFTVGEKELALTIVQLHNAHLWQRSLARLMSFRNLINYSFTQLMVIIQI